MVPRKNKKETKSQKLKELRKLKRKCLRLWSISVRKLAGNKCVACNSTDKVHAHHIEDSKLCSALRLEIRNGISLCAKHHKFGHYSAHKSFLFMYNYMVSRLEDLEFLRFHRNDPIDLKVSYKMTNEEIELTKNYLLEKISEFENINNEEKIQTQ